MSELVRRRELERMSKPELITKVIECERALRNVAKDYDTNFPCDGGCNVNDGPAEDCSRHGRSPRDLWERVEHGYRAKECIENVDAALRSDDRSSMRVVVAQEMITRYKQGSTPCPPQTSPP